MTDGPLNDVLTGAVDHYLRQAGSLLDHASGEPNPDELLAVQLAPDAFDTGFHLAVAIQFAARALCLPTGWPVPEIEEPYSLDTLRSLRTQVREAIEHAPAIDWTSTVRHTAGDAELQQQAADYVVRFAFPNMLFHISQAYAGLRFAGLNLGKADFDGMHRY